MNKYFVKFELSGGGLIEPEERIEVAEISFSKIKDATELEQYLLDKLKLRSYTCLKVVDIVKL